MILKDPDSKSTNIISKGKLLAYLNPIPSQDTEFESNGYDMNNQKTKPIKSKKHRVVDRSDLQLLLPGFSSEES
jgi:hypothetical protein